MRKISVSVKMYQLSFHMFISASHPEISLFSRYEFPLFIAIFMLNLLCLLVAE